MVPAWEARHISCHLNCRQRVGRRGLCMKIWAKTSRNSISCKLLCVGFLMPSNTQSSETTEIWRHAHKLYYELNVWNAGENLQIMMQTEVVPPSNPQGDPSCSGRDLVDRRVLDLWSSRAALSAGSISKVYFLQQFMDPLTFTWGQDQRGLWNPDSYWVIFPVAPANHPSFRHNYSTTGLKHFLRPSHSNSNFASQSLAGREETTGQPQPVTYVFRLLCLALKICLSIGFT